MSQPRYEVRTDSDGVKTTYLVVEAIAVEPRDGYAAWYTTKTGRLIADQSLALTAPELTSITIVGGGVLTLPSAATTLVGTDTTDTLTNKSGVVITKQGTLTENGSATSYTITIPIPAGAIIQNITVTPRVLWNGTSASLKVGDTADDDGFFVGVNLKATDAVVGEVLSIRDGDLWGGKEGAYLVAATGRRGPTATNFGLSYVAGSNITFIVTPGAADGTAGRTDVSVTYSLGATIAQVVV